MTRTGNDNVEKSYRVRYTLVGYENDDLYSRPLDTYDDALVVQEMLVEDLRVASSTIQLRPEPEWTDLEDSLQFSKP